MSALVYELSMPGRNSWNGRWSGEDRVYAIVRSIPRGKKHDERAAGRVGSYSYSFGDGWVARVDVRIVDGKEGARIRRKSQGFCGYDWMVSSIIQHGEIRA